eukprot:COSAG01_NODE_3164_length_6477_cov_6.494983_9_plen_85_part_01
MFRIDNPSRATLSRAARCSSALLEPPLCRLARGAAAVAEAGVGAGRARLAPRLCLVLAAVAFGAPPCGIVRASGRYAASRQAVQ